LCLKDLFSKTFLSIASLSRIFLFYQHKTPTSSHINLLPDESVEERLRLSVVTCTNSWTLEREAAELSTQKLQRQQEKDSHWHRPPIFVFEWKFCPVWLSRLSSKRKGLRHAIIVFALMEVNLNITQLSHKKKGAAFTL
jgi:hypothetical protein